MSPSPQFQAFTLKANGRASSIISDVHLSPPWPTPNPPAQERFHPSRALWDTGATNSMVSPPLVAALGLQPVGKLRVGTAAGAMMSLSYLVNIGLPNNVLIMGVRVCTVDPPHGGAWEMIIGMDIIMQGDFAITNASGMTWMSFRSPSGGAIDYVNEHNRELFHGVGRNDPCPCGKGQKFKFCHGARPS